MPKDSNNEAGSDCPSTTGSLVVAKFDVPTTGNVHLDQQIQWAVQSALSAIVPQLCAEIVNGLQRSVAIYERFPAPKPGTILNRNTAVDKICECGRVVTFPLSKLNPENSEL